MMMSEFKWPPGAAAPVLDHPSFGLVRATPAAAGPWLWQSLDLVSTRRGSVDIAFEAGADGPGDAHAIQLGNIVDQLGALTAAAAPMISAHLFGPTTVIDPATDLTWRGVRLTGRQGAFQLEFSSRDRPDSIAVRFEHSLPVAVEVER